jgi:transcriptional regulator with XRE-family HTH domain
MIAGRFKRMRQDLGLSQEDLARDLGISRSTPSKIERNEQQEVSSKILIGLIEKFGVNVLWLLTGEGNSQAQGNANPTNDEELKVLRDENIRLKMEADEMKEEKRNLWELLMEAKKKPPLPSLSTEGEGTPKLKGEL